MGDNHSPFSIRTPKAVQAIGFQECLRWISLWVRIKGMKTALLVILTGGVDKMGKLCYNNGT